MREQIDLIMQADGERVVTEMLAAELNGAHAQRRRGYATSQRPLSLLLGL